VTSLHVSAAGGGQYAESAGAPTVGPAFTMVAWYRPTTLNAGTVLGLGSSATGQYVALAMLATGQGFFEVSGGGTSDALAGSNFSDGSWHHMAGVSVSDSARIFYADGTAGTTDTTALSPTPASRDRVTVGMLRVNGSLVSAAQGDIAHVAIWSTALTAGEVASLAGGALPSSVQSGSLVFYSVLDGVASPEEETVAGRDLVWGAGGSAPTQSAQDPPVGSVPVSLTAATEADAAVSIAFTGGTAPRASQRVGWGVGVRSPAAETILAR
jgi:hypothetical protein